MFILQNYRIIGEPMKGGMGQVQHIYHNYWRKDAAMKQPLEKLVNTKAGRDCFFNECERWVSLGVHPNIVQCYFVCDMKGIPTVMMEWMEKGSLADYIQSGALYNKDEKTVLQNILDIALQMAGGLAYSHKRGVLHLDVKPANVLMDEDGCFKISDFGLASSMNQNERKNMYTPRYCAPEQYENEKLDRRTDIYCWAVSVLHMLVREANWMNGVIAGAAFQAIIEKAVCSVPEALKVLLQGCLQYDRRLRPENFECVIKELISVYNQVSDVPYKDLYADYDGTSLDALNNLGISQYYLGDLENALEKWRTNYWRNPNHFSSYYNYHLFRYRYEGCSELDFIKSEDTNRVFYQDKSKIDAIPLMHKSRWQYSVGAYASAYAYAYKAMNISEKLFGPSQDIFHVNYLFMKDVYVKYGPKVLKSYNLKKILGIRETVKDDCILLTYMCGDKILYVSKSGEIHIFDLQIPKIMTHKTNFQNVTCAAISRDGRFLALADCDNDSFVSKYELRVIDLQMLKVLLYVNGNHLFGGLQYLTFVQHKNTFPRLLASDGWRVLDWKITDTFQKYDTDSQASHAYEVLTKEHAPVNCITEVSGGCLAAKSDRVFRVFDAYSLEEIVKYYDFAFYEMGNKMLDVPGKDYVLILDKNGGYIVYDYVNRRVITQESFLLKGEEYLHQLSVNPDGKRMLVLCGDNMEVRSLTDYDNLQEPLWKESSFKTTAELMKRYQSISDTADVLDEALETIHKNGNSADQVKYKSLVIKLKNIQQYYECSHRPYKEYLILAAKMAQVYGFGKLRTQITFTDEEIEYMKPSLGGTFVNDEGCERLGIQTSETNHQFIDLVSLENGKVLKTEICARADLLGLAKDYSCLVCKNENGICKYRLISLEWLFDR